MSAPAGTTVAEAADRLPASRLGSLRRSCFATFVMLVVQFGLGIYVNLFVTVPGGGFGQAVANGPAGLTLHIAVGLLLIVAAIGFLVQAVRARHAGLITAAVIGLLAMIGAAASGSTFTNTGRDSASMAMGVLAVAGMLCYGISLYLLPRPRPAGS
jgi:hypothetical protein